MDLPLPKYSGNNKTEQGGALLSGTGLSASIIRQDLEKIYATDPDSTPQVAKPRSIQPLPKEIQRTIPTQETRPITHMEFLESLKNSGKPTNEVNALWHNYYQTLTDHQKFMLWAEYTRDDSAVDTAPMSHSAKTSGPSVVPLQLNNGVNVQATAMLASVDIDKQNLRSRSMTRSRQLQAISEKASLLSDGTKAQLRSLLFGATLGGIFLFVVMFGFFNERFIAPFIQPSRNDTATQLIIGDDPGVAISSEPKIIIPKIGVEAPAVYSLEDNSEATVQKNLEQGIIHYPSTALPGEKGNAIYFGHSSNNLLNPGKYKFVFVNLHKMKEGDTFMINHNGTRYQYKVFETKIVQPTDIDVLYEAPKEAMATLITCDPPGTSKTRLVIHAEQISPDPNANVAATDKPVLEKPSSVPGNAPSLWARIRSAVF